MVENIKKSNKKIEEFHFEQLQHADKLVTLGELTAEIAHEINNPTAIILSRADYLSLETNDNPQIKEYSGDIDVILQQTEKISKITSSILRYGRKLPQDFRSIKLCDVIKQGIIVVQPKLSKKSLRIDKQFDEEDCYISGDTIQLEQVIINLLTNAIDASGSGEKILIRLYSNDEGNIILEICDNGIGMDEETTKNIFSPFFTTKSDKKGTGLGLYIVKNICENMNAKINCTSELGKGTTFTIVFNNSI
jgi:signal transduction histidine kinase